MCQLKVHKRRRTLKLQNSTFLLFYCFNNCRVSLEQKSSTPSSDGVSTSESNYNSADGNSSNLTALPNEITSTVDSLPSDKTAETVNIQPVCSGTSTPNQPQPASSSDATSGMTPPTPENTEDVNQEGHTRSRAAAILIVPIQPNTPAPVKAKIDILAQDFEGQAKANCHV